MTKTQLWILVFLCLAAYVFDIIKPACVDQVPVASWANFSVVQNSWANFFPLFRWTSSDAGLRSSDLKQNVCLLYKYWENQKKPTDGNVICTFSTFSGQLACLIYVPLKKTCQGRTVKVFLIIQLSFCFQINLRLILVSGKTHEFLFSPSDSAAEITDHVYSHWPEGTGHV